jgi:sRNA-binding protein
VQDGWPVFRRLMLARLPAILGCKAEDIPQVFLPTNSPKILKVGIDRDLIARFPAANLAELKTWLRWWTKSGYYCCRMVVGKNRHDLDGWNVADISPGDAKHAANLTGRKVSPSKPVPPSPPKPPRPILKLRKVDDAKPAAKATLKTKAREARQTERIVERNSERDYIDRLLRRTRR